MYFTVKFRDPENPLVQFDGNCLVGLNDLTEHLMQKRRQRNLMEPCAYKHYYWYNTVLQEELYEVPIGYILQVFHWSIESSIRGAFCMRDQQFTSVSLIIGPTMEYWFGVTVKARETITKRGREYRKKPSNPDDQYCYMLPKSKPVEASCNCCLQYFKRATHKRDCRFIPTSTMTTSSYSVPLTTMDNNLATSKQNCDKELFVPICEQNENGVNDDDDDDDGDQRDVLFFRISLSKFRRTKFNDNYNRNKVKLNNKWPLRMTIIEELVEEE